MENVTKQEAYAEVRRWAWKLKSETIFTVSQERPNEILDVLDSGIKVRAKTDALVPWKLIDSIVDELIKKGAIDRAALKPAGVQGAYRSAFILAFLARTSFAEYRESKLRLVTERPLGDG